MLLAQRHSPFQNMIRVFEVPPAGQLLGSEQVPLLLVLGQALVHILLLAVVVVTEAEVDAVVAGVVIHQQRRLGDQADALDVLLVLLQLDHLVLHLLPVGLYQELGVLILQPGVNTLKVIMKVSTQFMLLINVI